nr:oxaloacetate decarboxylase [uncultured Schaedlerella sp.]
MWREMRPLQRPLSGKSGKLELVKAENEFGGMMRMKKVLGMILAAIGMMTAILSIILKVKKQISVSVIGGADGPTSIFLAGKVGGPSAVTGMIVGIVLIAVGVFMIVKNKA